MTPLIAQQTNNNSIDLQEFLENIVVKVCIFRILLFIILSVPLTFINLENINFKNLLEFIFSQKQILSFIVSGLFLNLIILISWRFFQNIIFFFRLQLITDTILGIYFMWITGGISSNGSFLLMGILFLYGRLLGVKTSLYNYLVITITLIIMTTLQIKNPNVYLLKNLDPKQAIYFMILQFSGLSLVLLLVKMGQSKENILLREIAKQKQHFYESEIMKTKVFDWINSGIIVIDKNGTIKSVNKEATRLLNLNLQDVLGKDLKNVSQIFHQLWTTWNKRSPKRHDIHLGSKIIGVSLSPIPEHQGALIIFTDITRIKELEQKIAQMERLSLIGELSAGLAHEIKNPLSGIKGALQLIGSSKVNDDQKQRLTKIIMRDIGRLDKLLKDFLYFAKPKQPEKNKIILEDFLKKLISTIKITYPELKIYITPSVYGKHLYWDEDQLKQVLLNLIINSIEAMNESKEKKLVLGYGKDRDNRKFIFVQDVGCGIDETHKDQLFYPFFTTKSDGTGLGLAIAQRLCSENDSWIEIKNRKSVGVLTKIYLSNKGE